MIHYRTFHNDDPPGLARVWNEALTARGAVSLPSAAAFEEFIFAKPYFDPAGLVVAVDGSTPVGFAHAGFGPTEDEAALTATTGVVCVVAVLPSHQRQGVGTELLRRSEAYLTGRGAATIYAGSMRPFNPFYLGLYGGSESPGFLASDVAAEPFLARRGYAIHETCVVLHRTLEAPLNVIDPRFAALRRRFDLIAGPRRGTTSWWQECVLGPLDLLDLRLADKTTGEAAARASAWEMVGHSHRWQAPSVGLVDVEVRADLRRQGLAKFLVTAFLRHLQEQFFARVEVQAMQGNDAALGLYRGLGFEPVDLGRVYVRRG